MSCLTVLKHSWIRRSAPLRVVDEELARRGVAGEHEAKPVPFEPIADRPIVDVDGRKALDDDAVAVIDDADLPEIELVDLDLRAGIRQQAEPRVGVPRERLHLLAHEMLGAVFRLRSRWTVEHQRLHPAAGPASDPHLREIADMVGVQMGGEIGGDVLVRDFERGEIRLRPRPEVHDELVAVAELDQPRAVRLPAAHERPAGAERDNAHLVGCQRLGVGEVIVASAGHARDQPARPPRAAHSTPSVRSPASPAPPARARRRRACRRARAGRPPGADRCRACASPPRRGTRGPS